jgi:hypothetical protein
MLNASSIPQSEAPWADPVDSHQSMVNNYRRLGFVVPRTASGQVVFAEDERDPTFLRP